MAPNTEKYLSPQEVAQRLPITVNQLAQLRYLGKGPAYTKFGRKVLYAVSDLDAYLASNRVTPLDAA